MKTLLTAFALLMFCLHTISIAAEEKVVEGDRAEEIVQKGRIVDMFCETEKLNAYDNRTCSFTVIYNGSWDCKSFFRSSHPDLVNFQCLSTPDGKK